MNKQITTQNASETKTNDAVKLFETLFDKNDLVLTRPTETYEENDRKISKVDYIRIRYIHASELPTWMERFCRDSELEKTNLFFGVHPRFGDDEKYDLERF